MKIYIPVIFLMTILSSLCFSETEVRLGGAVCSESIDIPMPKDGKPELFDPAKSFWGFEWEVIIDATGIGGCYLTDFDRNDEMAWYVKWYSEVIYISYHFRFLRRFVDPFIHIGLGTAGSVFLGDEVYPATERLLLSLFPVLSAGISLDLRGLVCGLRFNYTPLQTPPPVTKFETYPMKNVQAVIFCGVSIADR
ncbi:MAG: hypothetical protein JW881_00095 [Spirochaetales bacterium]|nr:hypothetical protein [Spirochaetales bacterium]